MQLNHLQQRLQHTYDLQTDQRVEDFVFSDPTLASLLGIDSEHKKETLLVHQPDSDCLNVSLYLKKGLLGGLQSDDPLLRLHAGNINAFCLALEGVSHFLYLVWNAERSRPVSRLEMELQAEVDKFVMACDLLQEQGCSGNEPALFRLFFHRCLFTAGPLRQRYLQASRLAARYCARHLRSPQADHYQSPESELRRFYRLSHHHKLRLLQ